MARYRIIGAITAVAILAAGPALFVQAFDASSTTFFVRQTIEEIAGTPTSSSFRGTQSGGQTAPGFSTTTDFSLRSGPLFILTVPVKPQYQQVHFHWRNNDGTESSATSATGGTQDTATSGVAKSTVQRLRIGIANTGGSIRSFSTQQFKLEYALQGGGCSSATYSALSSGGDWDMIASQLVEGSDTTNIAVSSGGVSDVNAFFLSTNGGQRETTSQTGALSLASSQFVELEYSVQALPAATDGATYCFRVTNAGSNSNFLYTVYPTVTLSAGSSVSCSTDVASTAFGALTASSISTASPNASTTMTCTGGLGCTLTIQDAGDGSNPGLATSTPAYLIPSNTATLSIGSEGYGIRGTTTASGSGATLTVNTAYNKGANGVGGLLRTATTLVSSTAAVTGREVVVTHQAAVAALTPVGQYNDTITYSCVGN